MDRGGLSRNKINWTIIAIALALAVLISVCTILSLHANKDKSFTGAKFIMYEAGGWHNGS